MRWPSFYCCARWGIPPKMHGHLRRWNRALRGLLLERRGQMSRQACPSRVYARKARFRRPDPRPSRAFARKARRILPSGIPFVGFCPKGALHCPDPYPSWVFARKARSAAPSDVHFACLCSKGTIPPPRSVPFVGFCSKGTANPAFCHTHRVFTLEGHGVMGWVYKKRPVPENRNGALLGRRSVRAYARPCFLK